MTTTVATNEELAGGRGLEGTTAFVTGASSGIGTAVARSLAARGVRIALGGRNRERLDELAVTLPGDPVVLTADVADGTAALTVAQQAIDALGHVDALVNNAGLRGPTGESQVTVEAFDETFAVNVRAPLLISSVIIPHMAENGGGSVVNLSSVRGLTGTTKAVVYGATKGAIATASQSFAADWGPRGVRVNVVSPGLVDTPMMAEYDDRPEAVEAYRSQVPLQRIAQVEDVADVVAFLLSPAARYVNAENITVDGGWSHTRGVIAR